MITTLLKRFGLTDEQVRLGHKLYRGARRQGLAVRRAFYLALYALDRPAKQIAFHLGRSVDTIRSHIQRAYRQLGVTGKSTLGLVLLEPARGGGVKRPRKRPADHPLWCAARASKVLPEPGGSCSAE